MAALDPGEIDLFRWADQLPRAQWDDLRARPPEEAARAVGGQWRDGFFRLPLLEREYLIDPREATVREADRPEHRVSYQTGLVLVHTLANAKGADPSGRMVAPQELPSGRFFFVGPHELPTEPLVKRFGDRPRELLERARALGGVPVEGADAAVRAPGLPRTPLYALVWGRDPEFEARAVLGVDDRAPFHLALDALWALCNIFVRRLCKAADHA